MPKQSVFNSPALYGISRHCHEKTGTWSWRVMISRQGVKVSPRNFADIKYGGVKRSLQAAKKHRDDVLKLFPPMSKIDLCKKIRNTNTSGIAGVHRRERSQVYAYWEARTQLPGGVILTKKFSVGVYGEEGAKAKALAERQKQLANVEGQPYLHSPAARKLYQVQVLGLVKRERNSV